MNIATRFGKWLIALPALVASGAAAGADFYVAPDGKDSAQGTQAQPFATVARAQTAVRDLKARQPDRKTPIVVQLRGGFYELAEPIQFGPADSGSADAPVVYEAAPGEHPILSGGRRISGWKVGPDGRWRVTLNVGQAANLPPGSRQAANLPPGSGQVANLAHGSGQAGSLPHGPGTWSFQQLFVGDQRRYVARLPKKGYFRIAGEIKPPANAKGYDQFVYGEGDLNPGWANRGDVVVRVFHIWSESQLRIESIDPAKRIVSFTGPTRGTRYYTAHAKGNRYRVENVKEALSEPGEFYLDRPTGELVYIPMPGEKPESTMVVAPRLEQIIVFQGDVANRKWVQHVQLKGLTLAHSNFLLPPQGMSIPQAAIGVPEAVTALGARNITIDTCCVRHTGAYAIGFGAGCRNNVVRDCELWDLGGGGVKVGHAAGVPWQSTRGRTTDPEALASHHTIENCTIAHLGRLHPPAVGVWIGNNPYNKVLHNDIYDLYYTSVSVGWVWGYGPSQANHNEIAFNHMHTIGQGVLSDMGGVYSLGIQPGTTIHNNHIHHVHSFGYGGWGLYTDEGSTDIRLYDNLVHHTKDGGFDQHYGRANLVTNNIFAFGEECMIRRNDRRDLHTSFTFERNIVLYDRGVILGGGWGTHKEGYYTLDYNLYWNADGKPVVFAKGMDFKAWQQKHKQDLHSIVADPLFVDAPGGDFHLKPDSPAITKLGFKPFDYTHSGRMTPATFTKDLPPVPRAFD